MYLTSQNYMIAYRCHQIGVSLVASVEVTPFTLNIAQCLSRYWSSYINLIAYFTEAEKNRDNPVKALQRYLSNYLLNFVILW